MSRLASALALLALFAGGWGCGGDHTERDRATRLRELHATRDALHAQLEERLGSDPAQSVPDAAAGDVSIGVEQEFLVASITTAAGAYLERIELDLSGKVSIHKEGDHSAKVLGVRIPTGHWRVDIAFPRMTGVLLAGEPTIVVSGDHFDVSVPVRIAEGSAAARVAVTWDANRVAGLVCDSFEHAVTAEGQVVPRDVTVAGRLLLDSDPAGPVVRSEVDDRHIRLHVRLNDESYERLREVLRQQSERDRCGMVLDDAKVEARVREFVDRGFRIRLPSQLERSFPLPSRFASVVQVLDRTLTVQIEAGLPTLDARALWSSARVVVDIAVPDSAGDDRGARGSASDP